MNLEREQAEEAENVVVGNPPAGILSTSLNFYPPEVLTSLFQYLPTNDLISCRIVCRSWKQVATFLYRRRPDNKKTYEYNIHDFCYLEQRRRGNSARRPFRKFLDLLKNSSALENLPFTGFGIAIPLQPQAQEMTEFLDLYGTHVRHLYLYDSCKINDPDKIGRALRQVLFAQMPNVGELELCSRLSRSKSIIFTPTPKTSSTEISSSLTLEKLRTLVISDFKSSTGLVADILKNAPNLKLCKSTFPLGFDLEEIDMFRDVGKLHVVNGVNFTLDKENPEHEKLEKIVETGELKLKQLSVYLKPGWLTKANVNSDHESNSKPKKQNVQYAGFLNQILEQNKNCIESFDRFEPIGFFGNAGLKFPVLSKLRNLTLESSARERNGRRVLAGTGIGTGFFLDIVRLREKILPGSSAWWILSPVFPPGLDIFSTFPNLTTLVLNLELGNPRSDAAEINWNKYFPKNENLHFPTVFTVRLENSSLFPVLKNISNMFLNCRNIHLNLKFIHNSSLLTAGAGIWDNFQHVENLELKLPAVDWYAEFFRGEPKIPIPIDSVFTGFDMETVETLMKLGVNELRKIPKTQVENMRKYSSIIQLKKLRRLVIDFPDFQFGLTTKAKPEKPSLSKISGVFAFEMMDEQNHEHEHEEPFQVKIMYSSKDDDSLQCYFVSPYSIFMD